jgi:phage terminase small subunit
MTNQLTDKQQKFVALYNGNATETAEMCGYSNPRIAGQRCLKHVAICNLIQEKRAQEVKPFVLDRQGRQKLWTEIAQSADESTKDRLKASELLARSEGDFLDRVAIGQDKALDPIRLVIEQINGTTKGVI